jgi:hypothetical protein
MTGIIAAVGSLGLNDSGWGGFSYSRVGDINRSWDLGLTERIEYSGVGIWPNTCAPKCPLADSFLYFTGWLIVFHPPFIQPIGLFFRGQRS